MVAVSASVVNGFAADFKSVQAELLVEPCHWMISPVWPVSAMVALLPPQIAATTGVAVPPKETGVTLIVRGAALAVVGAAQPALEINWQSIWSPLTRLASVYVLPLLPTWELFFFQT